MWTIFLFALADNLRSLRFQLSLVILLAFFIGNGFVYTWKSERVDIENEQIAAAGEKVYESVETVSDAVGKRYRILSHQTGTEFMAEAGSDWVFIVRYVISFLAIALTYNAISDERESGTLRLLLANPLPRAHVLIAKYLAHLVSLLAAVAVGALVSLLMLGLGGSVALGGRVALLFVLFLAVTAVYASVFLLLGLASSSAMGRSSTSLVTLILVWALLIVVIPQTSRLIAVTTVETIGPGWDETNELVN